MCSLPGKKAFAAGVELRVLTGRRQGRLRGREGVVTIEAEAAGMCFKEEECWWPPGAGETGNRSSPAASGGAQRCPHLGVSPGRRILDF